VPEPPTFAFSGTETEDMHAGGTAIVPGLLDGIDVAYCLFDDNDRAVAWNASFLRFFPEHDGHIHVGEPYRENLLRFYRVRLSPEEMPHVEKHVARAILRHRSQARPFVFEHRGRCLRVNAQSVPGLGRARVWTQVERHAPSAAYADGLVVSSEDAGQQVHVPDGILRMRADGTITSHNDQFARLYGLSPADRVSDLTFAELLRAIWQRDTRMPADHFAREIEPHLRDAMHFTGAPYEIALPGERWIRAIDHVAATGERTSVHFDITLFKREEQRLRAAEAAAHRREAHFRAIVEHAPGGMAVLDADGRLIEINRAFRGLLQAAREDLVGASLTAFMSEADAGVYLAALAEPAEVGQSSPTFEVTFWAHDGSKVLATIKLVWIGSADSQGRNVVVQVADLTTQRRAELARAESERLYRLLADNSSDLITLGPIDGALSYLSPAVHAMLGYTVEEAYSLGAGTWIAPEDRPAVAAATANLTEAKPTASANFRLRHKAGHLVWVEGLFRRVTDPQSGELTVITTIRDVSERQRQSDELRVARDIAELALAKAHNASEAKSDFLASMSHEIRTPLNGIIGYADLLSESAALGQAEHRHVRHIQSAGSALLALVNDVLDFSKIEAGQIELDPAPFSLAALIDEAVSLVAAGARQKGLALSIAVDPAVPAGLLGDEVRLRQVLLNLLNNAVKFTSIGHVEVRATVESIGDGPAWIRVEVEDTGIGISADKLDRLFQRFSQLDASIKRQFGGSGLGLAICKRLIELMGGGIGVSSNPGEGSTFWFFLPLEPAELVGNAAPAVRETGTATQAQVLLADDLEMNQELALAILQKAGYEVDVVADGADAVMAVQNRAYDVVLMDVQMPGMDGITATQRIRALPPPARDVPIITLTANVLAQQVETCRRAGMNDHVGKPFRREELIAAIERSAGASRQAEAAGSGESDGFDQAAYDALAAIAGPKIHDWHGKLAERLGAPALSEPACGADPGETARLAHTLVSAAGMLGFQGLSEAARALEAACLAGDTSDAAFRSFDVERERALARLGAMAPPAACSAA
jgi:PAS domain S-box-containing protein